MEVDEAAKALDEMRRRSEQTVRQGNPRRFPVWYTMGSAVSMALIWASGDLGGWAAIGLIVVAVALAVGSTVILERITGVRLRLRSLRMAPIVFLGALMVAVVIVVGTVLRLYDVPADATLSGLAGALVWAIGVGRAQSASAAPRERS
ncbi:hypothetical protein [Actinoplanes sp. G11-F43]|uniref:hypothetical protein n=1 Tax=Actinoplanes sp. G11-F43 TaxID=3424130 RepID=UPI003D330DF3